MTRTFTLATCVLLCGWAAVVSGQPGDASEPAGAPAEPVWPSAAETAALVRQVALGLDQFLMPSEPGIYTRENLQEYLGDAAERYFAYRYQWTVACRLTDRRSDVVLAADVFRFETDLDAFGAFSVDRDPRTPGELVPLPGQTGIVSAFWAGNQIHVWRGPLYLRFIPASLKPTLKPVVLELAQAVVQELPRPVRDPAVFALPPTRGLLLESVKFIRRNVLGQESLACALSATYGRRTPQKKLDVDCELLIFDGDTDAGALRTLEALREFLSKGGSPRPLAALGEAAFTLRHRELGMAYAMKQGRYVALVYQAKDPSAAEAMLRDIGKRIRLGAGNE